MRNRIKEILREFTNDILRPELGDGFLSRRIVSGLESILTRHISPENPQIEKPVDFSIEAQYGDITFTEREYFIGGPESPVRFKNDTGKGRALRYLLEHEGQEVSLDRIARVSRWANAEASMPALMREVNSCSWIFEVQVTPAITYKVTRKKIIVDQHGNHPDFEVVNQYGDIFIGNDRYYIGSKEKGICGDMSHWDGGMLVNLLRNIGRDIEIRPNTDIYAPSSVAYGWIYLLEKKINEFSTQFKLTKLPSEWPPMYRLEKRQ